MNALEKRLNGAPQFGPELDLAGDRSLRRFARQPGVQDQLVRQLDWLTRGLKVAKSYQPSTADLNAAEASCGWWPHFLMFHGCASLAFQPYRPTSPAFLPRKWGDYAGGISSFGETLALVAAVGTLIATVTTPAGPSEAQQFLRITEIMYHPPDPAPGSVYLDEDFEFIELRNIGTNPLNIFGVRFSAGITNSFTNAVRLLQPGQFVVLVRNAEAFATRYDTNGLLIAGTYAGSLANGGETLRLEDADGGTILDFAYDDAWYPATDGRGASLTIVDARADRNSWGRAASWRASRDMGGSPGRDDSGPLADFDGDGLPDAWE